MQLGVAAGRDGVAGRCRRSISLASTRSLSPGLPAVAAGQPWACADSVRRPAARRAPARPGGRPSAGCRRPYATRVPTPVTSAATNLNTRLPAREGSRTSAVFLVQKRERTEKTAYHGREPRRHRCGDESGRAEPLHDLSDHVEQRSRPRRHRGPACRHHQSGRTVRKRLRPRAPWRRTGPAWPTGHRTEDGIGWRRNRPARSARWLSGSCQKGTDSGGVKRCRTCPGSRFEAIR